MAVKKEQVKAPVKFRVTLEFTTQDPMSFTKSVFGLIPDGCLERLVVDEVDEEYGW